VSSKRYRVPVAVLAFSILVLVASCVAPEHPGLASTDYTLDDRYSSIHFSGYAYRFGADKLAIHDGLSVLEEVQYVGGRVLAKEGEDGRIVLRDFGVTPDFGVAPRFYEWRAKSERSELLERMEEVFRECVREGEYTAGTLIHERTAGGDHIPLCTLYFRLPTNVPRDDQFFDFSFAVAEVHIFLARCRWYEDDWDALLDEWDDDALPSTPPGDYEEPVQQREDRLYILCESSVNHMLLFPLERGMEFLRLYAELTSHHADFNKGKLREQHE
jgi:hypothetical protein